MKTDAPTYRAIGREAAKSLNDKRPRDYALASARFRALRAEEPAGERERATLEYETGIRQVTRPEDPLA